MGLSRPVQGLVYLSTSLPDGSEILLRVPRARATYLGMAHITIISLALSG